MMTTQTKPKVKRHPIRGALWGALMGLGAGLILFNFGIITLPRFSEVSTLVPWLVVIAVFIVLGILWGMYGPAKKPKGEPPPSAPAADTAPAEPEPAASPAEQAEDDGAAAEDDASADTDDEPG